MSETTFDGTLIPETSFEMSRSEDSLAKRVRAFRAEKPRFLELFLSIRVSCPMTVRPWSQTRAYALSMQLRRNRSDLLWFTR